MQNFINSSPIKPFNHKVFANIILADISGFTRLASRLSAEALKTHVK